jgi:hypothetical protein
MYEGMDVTRRKDFVQNTDVHVLVYAHAKYKKNFPVSLVVSILLRKFC